MPILSGPQVGELVEIVCDAFAHPELVRLVREHLNQRLHVEHAGPDRPLEQVVFELVESLDRQDLTPKFLAALREERPNNTRLKDFPTVARGDGSQGTCGGVPPRASRARRLSCLVMLSILFLAGTVVVIMTRHDGWFSVSPSASLTAVSSPPDPGKDDRAGGSKRTSRRPGVKELAFSIYTLTDTLDVNADVYLEIKKGDRVLAKESPLIEGRANKDKARNWRNAPVPLKEPLLTELKDWTVEIGQRVLPSKNRVPQWRMTFELKAVMTDGTEHKVEVDHAKAKTWSPPTGGLRPHHHFQGSATTGPIPISARLQ